MAYQDELDQQEMDLRIFFTGMRPLWQCSRYKYPEVHEYQSLSVPPNSRLKDVTKLWINKKPVARIFLNSVVQDGLGFNDRIPFLFRDMGVDKDLFMPPPNNPEYDLVYCGSIKGRIGLIDEIARLAQIGLKIIIVGDADQAVQSRFDALGGVTFTGRVGRHELPKIYKNARAGLNFTPDIYPFDRQTSTKTLEYCAAGLGVVSNRYRWAVHFAKERAGQFLWLDELKSKADMDKFNFKMPDVSDLEWSKLLDTAGLDEFLRKCAA